MIAISQIIRNNTRKGDIVVRYGGEEFMVLLPGASTVGLKKVAEKIKQTPPKNKSSVELQTSNIDENDFRRFKYTPTELQAKIDEYFKAGATQREVVLGSGANRYTRTMYIYTLTGMCLFCGFVDKVQLFDLERNNAYKPIIKKARSRIEKVYEENLQVTGNSANIFALKNFGWVDKQEIVTEERTIKLDV